jgi:glyoxylase-like metal-dependent hydrolase (beta-lactamase superfamily II)
MPDMELVEIAGGVHACLRPDRGLGWSNSGLVARGGGLVVDTFWDLPTTRAAMDLYAQVIDEPARRLVNTHHNGDHCWGNQLYAEAGSEIIGHRRCVEHFDGDGSPEFFQGLVEADIETLPPALGPLARALRAYDFRDITLTPPTTVMDDDEMLLDLDGTAVELRYLGPAHTAGDVIVHLPAEGVVFTGDLLFHQCTPIGWEGTTDQWVRALDAIAALEPAVVVPGHGPLAEVAGVLAMRDYLLFVEAETRAAFEAGRSPLECALAIELPPPYLAWNEPERLAFGVHRAYRELRGEPWDTRVDISAVLSDMAVLRARFSG